MSSSFSEVNKKYQESQQTTASGSSFSALNQKYQNATTTQPYQAPMINGKPYFIPSLEQVKQKPEESLLKSITIPGRGFTDTEINQAKPDFRDKLVGGAKWAGEATVGLAGLAHMGGNQLLRILPGYGKEEAEEAKAAREALVEKIEPFITPKSAEEAQVMRFADIAGFAVGWTKAGKLSSLEKAIVNADNINDARKVLRTGELSDDVITNLRLDEAVVNVKNTDDARKFISGVETIMDSAKKAGTAASPAVGKLGTDTIQPSRTPTPGAKPQIPRYARGAESMIEGAAATTAKATARSTADLARQADDIIASSTKDEIFDIANRRDDLGTAVASRYLNKLAEESATANAGRKLEIAEEAANLVNTKAARLMEAGREIQAASLLARMTPEGQLSYIAGEIRRYNAKNPTKKVPELTPEQASEILDEMNEISKMADGTEKQMRFFNLQRRVQEMIPSGPLRKAVALWKAGLLTGIKTLGLNLFSNASHFATETLADIAASGFDSVASILTGERTIAATFRGTLEGLREGTYKGKRYFLTGFDERNIGDKLDYRRVNFGKGPVGKKLQWYTDQVFQTVGAGDQPFYYATLARSYMNQALAKATNEGLKGKARIKRAYEIVEDPTEEMMEYAVRDATTAVFTQDTYLGKIAQDVQRLGGGAGEFVVPFGRTPSAVATQILNYTPVGAVAEVIKQIKKGRFDQRMLSKALGRSTVGTIPMVIGWNLAEQGLVSLDYPVGDSRQIELDKAEGVEYNSIKIGDEWRNPITLGPAGNLILFGAHMRNAIEKYGSNTEGIGMAALGLMSSFTEQTFLTGFENFTNLIFDPVGQGQSSFRSFIASFVPTIVSDVARATDTVERESPTVGTRVASRIPGLRQGLEPKVDTLGREQFIAGRGGEILPDFLESMIDPTRPSQDISTEVTTEMRRLLDLAEQTNNTDLAEDLRKAAPTRSGLFGYDTLTDAQETQLQKYAGETINGQLRNLFLMPEYKSATDVEKAKVIDAVVRQSKDAARARIVLEVIAAVPPEKRASALQRMYKDGLITNNVARILNSQ